MAPAQIENVVYGLIAWIVLILSFVFVWKVVIMSPEETCELGGGEWFNHCYHPT